MAGGDVTVLLERWQAGDRAAEQELINAVYPVLRDIARVQIRRNGGSVTLQATELVNEAYGRLFVDLSADLTSREHFFAVAATVIRRVLIDYLRARGRVKRGGKLPFVPIDQIDVDKAAMIDDSVDWIAVDEALSDLALVDSKAARVVELKFFSGLTTDRIAALEGSSVATVGRQWRFARAWLAQRLTAP